MRHVSGQNLARNFVNLTLDSEPDPHSPARLTTLCWYEDFDFTFFLPRKEFGVTLQQNYEIIFIVALW